MKKKKAPIIERFCRAIDVVPESVSHTQYIELHGRSLLKIRDGGRILLYTPTKIKIELPHAKGIVTVIGSGLTCSFFNLGAVGIEGLIDTVSYIDEDEK